MACGLLDRRELDSNDLIVFVVDETLGRVDVTVVEVLVAERRRVHCRNLIFRKDEKISLRLR
jgi:hypothetical protein